MLKLNLNIPEKFPGEKKSRGYFPRRKKIPEIFPGKKKKTRDISRGVFFSRGTTSTLVTFRVGRFLFTRVVFFDQPFLEELITGQMVDLLKFVYRGCSKCHSVEDTKGYAGCGYYEVYGMEVEAGNTTIDENGTVTKNYKDQCFYFQFFKNVLHG